MKDPSLNQNLPDQPSSSQQQVQRVLQYLVAEMSHEVRTPLAAVIGYSDLLLLQNKFGSLTEDQRRFLAEINKSSNYLWKVFDEFFIVYNFVQSDLKISPEIIDLNSLIQEAISATQNHWLIHHYKPDDLPMIEKNFPQTLPSVWVDSLRVQQAVTIILVEAIGATKYDKESKIVLSVNQEGEWISFKVLTSGGNSSYFADYSPRLFFSRAVIEGHGSQLQIRNTEETQLEITFNLPMAQNDLS